MFPVASSVEFAVVGAPGLGRASQYPGCLQALSIQSSQCLLNMPSGRDGIRADFLFSGQQSISVSNKFKLVPEIYIRAEMCNLYPSDHLLPFCLLFTKWSGSQALPGKIWVQVTHTLCHPSLPLILLTVSQDSDCDGSIRWCM